MSHFILNCGDAIEWLKTLDDKSVDLIVTDIAYESIEKWRKIGTTTRLKDSKGSSNKWFPFFPNDKLPELFEEMYRVLKNNSHCYFFSDAETMFIAKGIGEEAGFKFWKPIVWSKLAIGMGYHYRNSHEFILFFEKGKRKLNDLGVPDVLSFKRIWKGYPTEKPLGLMEVLVRQSSSENEIVIDPFMGSGVVGEAALNLNRSFWGNDIAQKSLDFTGDRLSKFK
jgi:site-specific DNA-methyltransferase (adenine-specific)